MSSTPKAGVFRRAFALIRDFFWGLDQAQRERAVALTSFEAREMENMFVLLLLGSFTGLPAPPSFLAVELLPDLEHELKVLNRRAQDASDALAEIMGALDAD
jgi:hypothetical protein